MVVTACNVMGASIGPRGCGRTWVLKEALGNSGTTAKRLMFGGLRFIIAA